MKKNVGKLLAGLAVFGLVLAFAGCVNPTETKFASGNFNTPNFNPSPATPPTEGGGSGKGGVLTITGLEGNDGKWVVPYYLNGNLLIAGGVGVNTTTGIATYVQISGGTAKLPMWSIDTAAGTVSAYTGSETLSGMTIAIVNTSSLDIINGDPTTITDDSADFDIAFINGNAEVDYVNDAN